MQPVYVGAEAAANKQQLDISYPIRCEPCNPTSLIRQPARTVAALRAAARPQAWAVGSLSCRGLTLACSNGIVESWDDMELIWEHTLQASKEAQRQQARCGTADGIVAARSGALLSASRSALAVTAALRTLLAGRAARGTCRWLPRHADRASHEPNGQPPAHAGGGPLPAPSAALLSAACRMHAGRAWVWSLQPLADLRPAGGACTLLPGGQAAAHCWVHLLPLNPARSNRSPSFHPLLPCPASQTMFEKFGFEAAYVQVRRPGSRAIASPGPDRWRQAGPNPLHCCLGMLPALPPSLLLQLLRRCRRC